MPTKWSEISSLMQLRRVACHMRFSLICTEGQSSILFHRIGHIRPRSLSLQ